eukprot:m.51626 g.51626  ORF g.51626 m.51626 type:complete len:121 (+) comp10744_c0_seq1:81-443(+)
MASKGAAPIALAKRAVLSKGHAELVRIVSSGNAPWTTTKEPQSLLPILSNLADRGVGHQVGRVRGDPPQVREVWAIDHCKMKTGGSWKVWGSHPLRSTHAQRLHGTKKKAWVLLPPETEA